MADCKRTTLYTAEQDGCCAHRIRICILKLCKWGEKRRQFGKQAKRSLCRGPPRCKHLVVTWTIPIIKQ